MWSELFRSLTRSPHSAQRFPYRTYHIVTMKHGWSLLGAVIASYRNRWDCARGFRFCKPAQFWTASTELSRRMLDYLIPTMGCMILKSGCWYLLQEYNLILFRRIQRQCDPLWDKTLIFKIENRHTLVSNLSTALRLLLLQNLMFNQPAFDSSRFCS